MRFEGGRLSGQTIGLSAQLNTLIGIRGSGKSSLLETVRYAFAISPSQDSAYKNELVKHVLCDGGKITLTVIDEHGVEYQIERINGERPIVLSNYGAALQLSPNAVLRNPLYFGQKDLSMSSPGYELTLLNKLVGCKIPSHDIELQSILSSLGDNLKQFVNVSSLPDRIRKLEDKDKEYEHKLQVFKERGITERLSKQTAYKTDISKLDSIVRSLSTTIGAYQSFADMFDTSGIQLSGYVSDYNAEIFSRAAELIASIYAHVAEMTKHALCIDADKEALNSLIAELRSATEALREEFAQIKREIADDSIDLEGFEKYQTEQIKGRDLIAQLNRSMGNKDSIQHAVADGFRRRNELLRQIYMAYQREIDRINSGQQELIITIEFKGNKPVFLDFLKTAFKGSHITEAKYQRITEEFSDMAAIVEDYFLNDGKKLHEIVSEREYSAVVEKILANYANLIAMESPNLVHITYHGKELSKHSMGQRASALMLFILSQDDNDIVIIDQPEDDLDNQVVYTEFIKTLKEKKAAAQFIFATHNANIPVLDDAEKVIAAQYLDNAIELTAGSIDTPAAHKKIVEIMEGGYEAFQRRNAIYTSWQ